MRKHQRNYPSRVRSSGQTTLQSFLFKLKVVDAEANPSPLPPLEKPISLPKRPKREIVKVTKKTIKEKLSAFSSVGRNGDGEARTNIGNINEAVFKRFNSSMVRGEDGGASTEIGGDGDGFGAQPEVKIGGDGCRESRKRKSPFVVASGDDHKNTGNHVVVLGDDPKPRPERRQVKPTTGRVDNKTLYNHYASGSGWWHGDMEGVDSEEVGWNDEMWEGVGSVTLGGLEWH